MDSYSKLKKAAGPYLLGIILGIGATVAWAVAVMLAYYPLTLTGYGRTQIQEYVRLTVEGEALLVTAEPSLLPLADKHYMPDGKVRATSSNQRYTYSTLDGQQVEIPMAFQGGYHSLVPASKPKRLPFAGPQIKGFLSSGQRPAYWYAVFRNDTERHSYFVGFDPYTRLPIGYLATAGFRVDRPPADEQFTVDRWVHSAMAPGGGTVVEPSFNSSGTQFLVADDKLYAIDFDEQSVELLPLPARVVAMGTTGIPSFPEGAKDVDYGQKIVVRLPQEFVLLNSDATEWRRVPIPPPARELGMMVYGTLKEDIILETHDAQARPQELYWIDPQGSVVRQASVALPPPAQSVARDYWMMAGIFPAPGIWAFAAITTAPRPEASLLEQWLPVVPVCLISALLAILCYRRQRGFSHGGAAIWAVLVFVLGPPGLIGYFAHRRWPPKQRCETCGATVPRDRRECAACAAEFPAAALRGIEVFA